MMNIQAIKNIINREKIPYSEVVRRYNVSPATLSYYRKKDKDFPKIPYRGSDCSICRAFPS